ncbi:MAG: ComEC/Rec2 family competence protein [Proteobacteria bacterium]|nr:ComEC/Rec2 family competence protein [Pseudomonadota bacterium]MDA1023527.1 ComEC/Rec2 family competence protein [Pseudomonadota bacterium]
MKKINLFHSFRLERERWVLWLPVFFGLGIAGYFSLSFEPPLWSGVLVMMSALAGLFFLLKREGAGSQAVMTGLIIVAITAAGFSAAGIRTASVAAPVLEKRIGPTSVTGLVTTVETFPDALRVTLERARIAGLGPEKVPQKVRVKLRGSQVPSGTDIRPGDWIQLRAILSPPSAPAAPGAFDFQRFSFFRQIGAVGFSIGQADVIASARERETGFFAFSFSLALAELRQSITGRVQDGIPGANGPVAAALMTGERRAIPEDLMSAFRDSGVAHLLAISGLHIGLVAGILFVGFRGLMALAPGLALHYPIKKWAAFIAIIGAFVYALIAGATVPSQRAFLMVGLVLTGVLLDRRGLSVRLVAWAALIILALQPESLLGPSFQMSFAAVTALIAGYEFLSERRRYRDDNSSPLPPWLRKAGFYLAGVALTTLIAGTATAPFAIYHFNRFADYGLMTNLIAVPVTALWVMPWAVVSFLLMPFGLETFALAPMGWGVGIVVHVAKTIAAWPGAVTLVAAMPVSALAAITLGGVWICLWRRRWRLWGLAAIAGGLVMMAFVQPPDILIDGQGRLLAVQTAQGQMAVSNLRRARFDREIWLRRSGQREAIAPWPKTGASPDRRLVCDLQGCLYKKQRHVVALSYAESALAEDCWVADIVIATVPVRRNCPAKKVIDRFDLWRQGAHALWLNKNGVTVKSVNGLRGSRPWVLRRGVLRPKPKSARPPA